MDFQKEREAFENWHIRNMDINSDFEKISEQDSPYMDEHVNNSWLTWQAAKAQAVPEGFVLVPKEPTDKTIARMINTPIEVNLLCDHADIFLSEGEAYIAYQAMIEAQEPAND